MGMSVEEVTGSGRLAAQHNAMTRIRSHDKHTDQDGGPNLAIAMQTTGRHRAEENLYSEYCTLRTPQGQVLNIK